ncbi:hypothetical protein BO221_45310 [Archangium sp. Cb G35]|uniref:hypothetical protein n=1 Tax=Archangium sp. Cb G35 TaxID=1920190 RepID=UPI0009360226|nr:hypothetical protein [Archangium sp. Cb G35]OJT17345.1 hypothetical protein BO221_45310 [Archangium sp. Cb G35]
MLALTLTLILSQIPPAPPPAPAELHQRFDKQRPAVLKALAATYTCKKPGAKPQPLCDAALSEKRGTAADIRGQNALMGLSWMVKRGKNGKAVVSAPRISALALNEHGTGVLAAITEITPENAKEQKLLEQLVKDYEAFFAGQKANVTVPGYLLAGTSQWSKSANHPLEKKDGAWVFKGASGTLRKVGERWVLIGLMPGEAIGVSVFTP